MPPKRRGQQSAKRAAESSSSSNDGNAPDHLTGPRPSRRVTRAAKRRQILPEPPDSSLSEIQQPEAEDDVELGDGAVGGDDVADESVPAPRRRQSAGDRVPAFMARPRGDESQANITLPSLPAETSTQPSDAQTGTSSWQSWQYPTAPTPRAFYWPEGTDNDMNRGNASEERRVEASKSIPSGRDLLFFRGYFGMSPYYREATEFARWAGVERSNISKRETKALADTVGDDDVTKQLMRKPRKGILRWDPAWPVPQSYFSSGRRPFLTRAAAQVLRQDFEAERAPGHLIMERHTWRRRRALATDDNDARVNSNAGVQPPPVEPRRRHHPEMPFIPQPPVHSARLHPSRRPARQTAERSSTRTAAGDDYVNREFARLLRSTDDIRRSMRPQQIGSFRNGARTFHPSATEADIGSFVEWQLQEGDRIHDMLMRHTAANAQRLIEGMRNRVRHELLTELGLPIPEETVPVRRGPGRPSQYPRSRAPATDRFDRPLPPNGTFYDSTGVLRIRRPVNSFPRTEAVGEPTCGGYTPSRPYQPLGEENVEEFDQTVLNALRSGNVAPLDTLRTNPLVSSAAPSPSRRGNERREDDAAAENRDDGAESHDADDGEDDGDGFVDVDEAVQTVEDDADENNDVAQEDESEAQAQEDDNDEDAAQKEGEADDDDDDEAAQENDDED